MSEKFEDSIDPYEKQIKRHSIELEGGGSIVVEETQPGRFTIVDESITDKNNDPLVGKTEIAFFGWDESVEDLDGASDLASVNASNHLRWNDVELKLDEIKAPSLDRLKEALQHIEIMSYCPGDL